MTSKELDDAIIDLLSKCKFARACDIASKLGISIYTCRSHLDKLRRRGVDVGSVSGKGYFYKPVRDNETNQSGYVIRRQHKVLGYIKKNRVCTFNDICSEFDITKQIAWRDVWSLSRMNNAIVVYNKSGFITFDETYETNPGDMVKNARQDSWIDSILSILSVDTPMGVDEIAHAIDKSYQQTLIYLHIAKEKSLVMETTNHYYMLPSECPADILHSGMVKIWFMLRNKKSIKQEDIISLTGFHKSSVRVTMASLLQRCPYIVRVKVGRFVEYRFDEDTFKK